MLDTDCDGVNVIEADIEGDCVCEPDSVAVIDAVMDCVCVRLAAHESLTAPRRTPRTGKADAHDDPLSMLRKDP